MSLTQLADAIETTAPTDTIPEKYKYAVAINPIVMTTMIIEAMMVEIPFFIIQPPSIERVHWLGFLDLLF